MVRIKLYLDKSVEENAEVYFAASKKAKKKLDGAKIALINFKKKLNKVKDVQQVQVKKIVKVKREWYQKFRWFISSEGVLVIGGKDATTNEIVIKKHVDPGDIIFHTEMSGSPFVVIKGKHGTATLKEAGEFCACFSKSWKLGIPSADVFYVNYNQVSKEAQSGEYLSKGSFMIYGKKTFIRGVKLQLGIGIYENKVMCGPVNAVKANCDKYVIFEQGNDKKSDFAKKIAKKLGATLDDINSVLPAGTFAMSSL